MKREKILTRLFEISNEWYRSKKKKSAWPFTVEQLIQLPQNSIGNELGLFLSRNGFNLLAKSEQHDIFHILTGYNTSVPEEIAMQYYLYGNGKRSTYLYGVIIIGLFTYPDQWITFYRSYKKGGTALPFFHLNYLDLLSKDLNLHLTHFNINQKQTA